MPMSEPTRALLEVRDVTVSYGEAPVIHALTISLERSTLVGLIGPNGAGKTSLLLSLSGQFQPASGRIHFNGDDIYEHNRDYKSKIGYVHEDPFFYPYLTVEDFLRFVAGVKNVPGAEVESQIRSLLDLADLWTERDKLTSALSMGMRKKLAISAAMVGRPRLLFLDEALNGIDIEGTFRLKRRLREFVDAGGTVILSTHTLEVAEKLCDRYVVLEGGRVLADLRADDVTGRRGIGEEGSLEQHVMRLLARTNGDASP